MQRRSFIQSLLAVPVVAAVAKLVPAAPPTKPEAFPVDSITAYQRALQKSQIRNAQREPTYAHFRAAAGIRRDSMLRTFQFGDGVVPMDNEPGGWFVGVAMHDAMEGDMVKVMTEGMASVRFQ